jgi:hypothetical protein
MGLAWEAAAAILLLTGMGMAVFYMLKNKKDRKKSIPVFKLSYSGEYIQKKFWANEIIIIGILTQGFGILKLSLLLNIMMLSLIGLFTLLYLTQIRYGVIGKTGIVSATKYYGWGQVDSVEWITGLKAENPGYPSWGLVRFHIRDRYVEFIVKKKQEEDVRSFVDQQMTLAKAN